jgi:phosphomannomutase
MSSASPRDYRGAAPLPVAWDAGNGAAGPAMSPPDGAPARQHHPAVHETIDGRFPNHHPDPTEPENLGRPAAGGRASRAATSASPSTATATGSASVDGQGRDRLGRPDPAAAAPVTCWPHKPGAPIIADVKASQVLFDEIAAAGGRPLMWKTGHS